MEKKKKPKYKIGDTVVITMYGTVGRITDVKWLDGLYIYEVNKSEGLYKESGITILTEYNGSVCAQERIEIEYKFFIDDLVQVFGYNNGIFKIIGFHTEIWRYKEDAWEDVIYELYSVYDGEWLEANEEELTLIAEANNAENIIQKPDFNLKNKQSDHLKLVRPDNKLGIDFTANIQKGDKNEFIDHLLDIYNDYQILYEWFKDQEFNYIMKIVLKRLEDIAKSNNDGKLHL